MIAATAYGSPDDRTYRERMDAALAMARPQGATFTRRPCQWCGHGFGSGRAHAQQLGGAVTRRQCGRCEECGR